MKRMGKTITIVFIILMLLTIPVSYAINEEKQNQSLIEVNKQEISVGETLEISLNLNQVQWEKVKFTLYSNWDISSVYLNESEIGIEKQNQEVILEVDKTKSNLEKIVLYYPILEGTAEGTTITLQGKIENLEPEEENQTENSITSQITVKIVTNQNSENNEPEHKNNNGEVNGLQGNGQNSSKQEITNQAQPKGNQTTETITMQAKSTNYNSENMKTEETVSYKGSNNNYLSSLTINGYSLNKEFNKESSTYFVTVEEDVDSLEIVTTVEDSTATVCVEGANNLKEGANKILISVTAENGNVRNYRIYVTKG